MKPLPKKVTYTRITQNKIQQNISISGCFLVLVAFSQVTLQLLCKWFLPKINVLGLLMQGEVLVLPTYD